MKKEARLTFRIQSDLKTYIETIAQAEGRSVAQICEAFLRVGVENYKAQGSKLLKRFLSQT